MKQPPWIIESIRLFSVLLAALLVGLALGQITLSITLALVLFLAWHAFHAFRLLAQQQNKNVQPAEAFPAGLWRDLWLRLTRLSARSRRRKKKTSRFFKRFREATRAFPYATLLINRSNRIEWCNPAASNLLEVDWPLVRGSKFTDILASPEVTGYLRRADFSQPLEFSPSNNNTLILSMLITPFGKKRYQRLVVLTDITRISNLDRTRRDFVANASHEFRTPLTVIAGYLEAMSEEKEISAEWQRPLQLMQQQTQRMERVVNDLLTLSRLETDPSDPDRQPINIPRLLREICDDVSGSIGESKQQIHTDIDQNLWLKGSYTELQSAFGNLLHNAVQHTPEGTEIWVRWQQQGGNPQFSVQDNGNGIAEHYIPRLTERFFRVDKARSRETGSTGLGLAIVKQIVQRYGGELVVNSTPGAGSTFSCVFPGSLILESIPGHGEE
jgi:two-component system phosphate regulon sensor histidine kinase PhoR